MSQFTAAQISAITILRDQGHYADAYNLIADTAAAWINPDGAVITWLRGAAEINAGSGTFSDFVRGYSEAQYLTRYGTPLPSGQIQTVSDEIAFNVISHVINNNSLPTISQIAVQDAGPAARILFEGDAGGWAGNPLFTALGHYGAFASNIVERPGDTYDALAMIKFTQANSTLGFYFDGVISNIVNNPNGLVLGGVYAAAAMAQTAIFLTAAYGIEFVPDSILSTIYLGRMNANDILSGSSGDDIINAGAGSDTINGSAGNDILDGGSDLDFVDYSIMSAIVARIGMDAPSLTPTTADFVAEVTGDGTDLLFNIEGIVGSSFADNFALVSLLTAETFDLDGGDGEDTLDLSELNAGLDVDAVEGTLLDGAFTFQNFEVFIGGSGNDRFTLTGAETRIDGGAGRDTADFSQSESGIQTGVSMPDIEVVYGSNFNDTLIAGDSAMEFHGGGGQDTLIGGGRTDILDGSDDNESDTLTGGGGADIFLAGTGDIITDATANDRLAIAPSSFVSGVAKRSGSSGDYTNSDGHTFALDGTTLTVTAGGRTITVQNFDDGDLGIRLKDEEDPETPEPPEQHEDRGRRPFPIGPFFDPPTSPLVLDLDGDGLELTALLGSQIHFDLDASGSREATGWVSSDDALLVYDANSDGMISDGHELFGNDATNGFDVLAFYDGRTGGNFYSDPTGGAINTAHRDGVIDADDAIFASLQLWRDLDQDGVTDAGELFSLAALGIQSINLGYANVNTPVLEHWVRQVSTATTTTGSIDISDVWFSTDRANTVYDYDPDTIGFEGWPDLHGIGAIAPLRLAMSQDQELADSVKSFIADAEGLSLEGLRDRFTDLLLTWAGVEDRPTTGRGSFFGDVRILEFLELAHDQEYLQLAGTNEGTANPGPYASVALLRGFESARDILMLQFLSQIPAHYMVEAMGDNGQGYFASRFLPLSAALSYDVESGDYTFDPLLLVTGLGEFDPTDPLSFAELTATLDFLPLLASIVDVAPQVVFDQLRTAFLDAGRPEMVVLADWYFVTNDVTAHTEVRGSVRVATEDGYIVASNTSDLIVVGADLGVITIGADNSADRIVLSDAFSGANFTVSLNSETGDVTMTFATLNTTLVLKAYLVDHGFLQIEDIADVIYFPDGRVVDADVIRAAVVGTATSGDDVLVGTGFDETLNGFDGNDLISGGAGEDIILGGAGADIISGGSGADVIVGGMGDDILGSATSNAENAGNDTYVIRSGDGHDVLNEAAGGSRNVVDLSDSSAADVNLAWDGDDLILSFSGRPDDSLTLVNFRDGEIVSTFLFAEEVSWTYRDIINEAMLQAASIGNDVLTGTSGRDLLAGGLGDDILRGGASSFTDGDVFLYRRGDGDDVIYASYSYSDDELVLRGIEPEDVAITRNGNDAVLTFSGGGSVILHNQFHTLGWNVLERVVFDSGVVWSERELAFATQSWVATPTIVGTSASETLTGTAGRDAFDSGAGDDLMEGGSGADTYFFGAGDGHDTIHDEGRDDAVEADVVVVNASSESVVVSRSGTDVILTLTTGETLTLGAFFSSGTARLHFLTAVERLIFSDGVQWDASQIAEAAWIRGSATADALEGSNGSDTFSGGAGDDTLTGGYGDDVYVVRSGDGADFADEWSGAGEDTIWFQDATAADVRVLRQIDGDDDFLIVERLDGTGSVRLKTAGYVETVRFSDGATRSVADLIAIAVIEGTEQSEVVNGSYGNDQIEGRGGADELWGSGGFDTYHWSRGDGDDTINDFQGGDRPGVLAIHGIDPDGVVLSRVTALDNWGGSEYDLLVTIQPSLTTDVAETIRIAGFFTDDDDLFYGVSAVAFDSGVTWNVSDLIRRSILVGSESADTLNGTAYAETIEGNGGDDTLQGEGGSDLYRWRSGDGNDTIVDEGHKWDLDTLKLTDVTSAGVTFSRDGDDLKILVLATNETLVVTNHFWVLGENMEGDPDRDQGVERIVFSDSSSLDRNGILSRLPGPDPDPDPDPPGDITGTEDFDYLPGSEFGETISGLGGDDYLAGQGGDDTLVGGGGSDSLEGGEGSDVIIWAVGDGDDQVGDSGTGASDVDRLVLTGVNSSSISITTDGPAMILHIGSEQITVFNQFAGELDYYQEEGSPGLEEIVFSDETWNRARILTEFLESGGRTLISGSAGADTLTGSSSADTLFAGSGNDLLNAGGGDDWIIGGAGDDDLTGDAGDDDLVGGSGSDTFRFNAGNGADTLTDFSDDFAGTDTLILGAGILPGDVVISRVDGGATMLITFVGGTIQVLRQFEGYGTGLEQIVFADSTVWDVEDMQLNYLAHATTAGDDYIESFTTNDILQGGTGNDILSGMSGSDTYFINAGDGHDQVWDYGDSADVDTLIFGAGLTSTSVVFSRDDDSAYDLTVGFSTGETVFLQNIGTNPMNGNSVEVVTFGDNISLTRGQLLDTYLASLSTIGDDRISGFERDDVLTGGQGADTFVFRSWWGADQITDFDVTEDIVEIDWYGEFNDLMNYSSQDGADVLLSMPAGSVRLVGVDLNDLTENNFVHAGQMRSSAEPQSGALFRSSLQTQSTGDVLTFPAGSESNLSKLVTVGDDGRWVLPSGFPHDGGTEPWLDIRALSGQAMRSTNWGNSHALEDSPFGKYDWADSLSPGLEDSWFL